MSALVFKSQGGGSQCSTPGCQRAGRYSMLIAGFPVHNHNPYATKDARELLCRPCMVEARELWDELSEAPHAPAEPHMERLNVESVGDRIEAKEWLLENGWTKDEVRALAREAA